MRAAAQEQRVVLVDDNGVRATMTASWLKQMGWADVAVLVADPSEGDWRSGPDMPRLQARLDSFLKAIPDLKGGQQILITYFPGTGTLLRAGRGEEITIPGKDFADALFSVWLGKQPVDDDLKGEMLRNR